MKIDPQLNLPASQSLGSVGASDSASNAKPAKVTNENSSAGSDQANLSSDAVQLSSLRARLNSVPEIRQDRVDTVRAALNSGTYSVTNQQIAQSLVRDFQAGGPSGN